MIIIDQLLINVDIPGALDGTDSTSPHGPPEDNRTEEVLPPITDNASSSSSSWFRFMSRKSSEADKEIEAQENEKEERKSEKAMVYMIRKIRNKFIERKLDGIIYIRRVFGVVSAAMTCRVNASDGGLGVDILEDGDDELPFQCRRAVTSTDIILDSLERRSKGWDGVEFNEEIMLTRGLQLGISDPFFGMIGWSLQVDLSATVRSLLASRKKYELARASSVSESTFRFSLSFSSKSDKAALDIKNLPPSDPTIPEGDSDVSEEASDEEDRESAAKAFV